MLDVQLGEFGIAIVLSSLKFPDQVTGVNQDVVKAIQKFLKDVADKPAETLKNPTGRQMQVTKADFGFVSLGIERKHWGQRITIL